MWQVAFSSSGNVLRKAGNFRLTVELRSNGDVHPRQITIVILSLRSNTTQVREEILYLTLKVGETVVVS